MHGTDVYIYIYYPDNYLLYSQGSFFHLLVGPVDFVPDPSLQAQNQGASWTVRIGRAMECLDVPLEVRING